MGQDLEFQAEAWVVWANDGLLVGDLAAVNVAPRAPFLTQPLHPVRGGMLYLYSIVMVY